MKPGAQYHLKAAEHHEYAARHHREAAKRYEEGNLDKAAHHAHLAHGHMLHATNGAQEAVKAHLVEYGRRRVTPMKSA